jgi:hypothetical protein
VTLLSEPAPLVFVLLCIAVSTFDVIRESVRQRMVWTWNANAIADMAGSLARSGMWWTERRAQSVPLWRDPKAEYNATASRDRGIPCPASNEMSPY